MRHVTLAALTALAALAFSTPIFAHAHLKSASPASKSTVHKGPTEVSINFTEELEPKFSSIEVKDAAGSRVDKADVHLAPNDPKQLAVSVDQLKPVVYTVIWHATSTDTHKTDGTYTFSVGE